MLPFPCMSQVLMSLNFVTCVYLHRPARGLRSMLSVYMEQMLYLYGYFLVAWAPGTVHKHVP
jgi:hypothetical protein